MKCFVIMPFGNPAVDPEYFKKMDHIYEEWIKPTVESILIPSSGVPISCHRADRENRPGNIIDHVIENLVEAFIVIADLSDKNPNVFYELGVRHAVSNNTILIARKIEDIPFDLRSLRTITYDYTPEKMIHLKKNINNYIISIFNNSSHIDNPVRTYLLKREMEKISSIKSPPGFDSVKEILTEIGELKKVFSRETEEIRSIVKSITNKKFDLSQNAKAMKEAVLLEGVWEADPSGSTCCMKIVDGEIRAPYCYEGDDELTGHYFNLIILDGIMYGRFKWLKTEISGYAMFKIVDNDKLEGGWWYSESVPRELESDLSKLDYSIKGIHRNSWKKIGGKSKYKKWANDYFEHIESRNKILPQ